MRRYNRLLLPGEKPGLPPRVWLGIAESLIFMTLAAILGYLLGWGCAQVLP